MVSDEKQFIDALYPKVEEAGYYLLSLEISKSSSGEHIHGVVFRKGGVSHDDCAKITDIIKKAVESKGEDADGYSYTISSPGISRKLKGEREYNIFAGESVRVHLRGEEKDKLGDKLEGKLIGFENGVLSVVGKKGNNIAVKKDGIKYVKLNY